MRAVIWLGQRAETDDTVAGQASELTPEEEHAESRGTKFICRSEFEELEETGLPHGEVLWGCVEKAGEKHVSIHSIRFRVGHQHQPAHHPHLQPSI